PRAARAQRGAARRDHGAGGRADLPLALAAPPARELRVLTVAMAFRRAPEWINAACALAAVAASTAAALVGATPRAERAPPALPGAAEVAPMGAGDGQRYLVDATGARVALAPRRRIASGSLLADPVLLA